MINSCRALSCDVTLINLLIFLKRGKEWGRSDCVQTALIEHPCESGGGRGYPFLTPPFSLKNLKILEQYLLIYVGTFKISPKTKEYNILIIKNSYLDADLFLVCYCASNLNIQIPNRHYKPLDYQRCAVWCVFQRLTQLNLIRN